MAKTILYVTATHAHPDYCFTATPVAVDCGWISSRGHTYHADHPKLGCGKDAGTIDDAIRSLFSAHGCKVTSISASATAPSEPKRSTRETLFYFSRVTIERAACSLFGAVSAEIHEGQIWVRGFYNPTGRQLTEEELAQLATHLTAQAKPAEPAQAPACEGEVEPENLDCMAFEDLLALRRKLQGSEEHSKEWLLCEYAYHKMEAIRDRLQGRVAGALEHEKICQGIYKRLPQSARW